MERKNERKEGYQDEFLERLAVSSSISRERLDSLVERLGFEYIRANSLFVHKTGYKHFGSDLLKSYRENPARYKKPVDA